MSCFFFFELVYSMTDGGEIKPCFARRCFPYVYPRFCSVESKASESGSSLSVRFTKVQPTFPLLASVVAIVVIRVPFPFPSRRRHPAPVYLQLTGQKILLLLCLPNYYVCEHRHYCKHSAFYILSIEKLVLIKGEESFLTQY